MKREQKHDRNKEKWNDFSGHSEKDFGKLKAMFEGDLREFRASAKLKSNVLREASQKLGGTRHVTENSIFTLAGTMLSKAAVILLLVGLGLGSYQVSTLKQNASAPSRNLQLVDSSLNDFDTSQVFRREIQLR